MNMHIPSRQNIFREMRDYLMIAFRHDYVWYRVDSIPAP